MTKKLLTILAGLLLLAGCSSNYVIVKTNGQQFSVRGRPKYRDGYYYYTDTSGQKERIFASRVREVGPANMVDDPASKFKNAQGK